MCERLQTSSTVQIIHTLCIARPNTMACHTEPWLPPNCSQQQHHTQHTQQQHQQQQHQRHSHGGQREQRKRCMCQRVPRGCQDGHSIIHTEHPSAVVVLQSPKPTSHTPKHFYHKLTVVHTLLLVVAQLLCSFCQSSFVPGVVAFDCVRVD